MTDAQFLDRVRHLRSEGRSPKEIARALGVAPATVAPLIRRMAQEDSDDASSPALLGCWVSPGWSVGLGVDPSRHWPGTGVDGPGGEWAVPGRGGIVGVLVAREYRYARVTVCGYLVDTWCLGVKNALGPRLMSDSKLPPFRDLFFDVFESAPIDAPIELAQHLVWGAVDYARRLGFAPHPDLEPAAGHLERPSGPSAITFGNDGRPFYIEGPYDDAARTLRTLERSVAKGNFSFELDVFDSFSDTA